METILWCLAVLGYLYFGWFLADLCLTVWLANDNKSKRAFLLFPISFYKELIGQTDVNPLSIFDVRERNTDSMGGRWYKGFMMVLWPLKFFLNLPAIIVISLATRSDLLMGREKTVTNYDVSAKDDIPTIFRKRRSLDDELARLHGKKEAINIELAKRKRSLDDTLDLETRVDNDISKLKAEVPERPSSGRGGSTTKQA